MGKFFAVKFSWTPTWLPQGFSEVSSDKVSILVNAAEKAVEIDIGRAKLAIERATERLALEREAEDVDFLRAEAALRRAIQRLKLAEKSI